MITREFNLYLHAGHSIPLVINVNQYDQGEQWLFTLFNADGTQYTPSSGAIVGIKSDNLGIINSGTVDGQGRVVISETQQMTASVGKAVFELVIDDGTHGTANFVVLVEEKPGNNADLSETDISMIEQAIEAASSIKPYGSPLVASTVAGMTDHDKVYVYVGSETGYTSGNWYYWDGSAWASGGVYNSVAVQTDTTLTLSGVAADAKKTGDEISDLKSQINRSGLSEEFKSALYNLVTHIGMWTDGNAQTYIDDLYDAMNPPTNLSYITAVYTQSGTVYDTDTLNDLKSDLVVTAHYDDLTTDTITFYALSGTLEEGTSTITVTYMGKTTTFDVTVIHSPVPVGYTPLDYLSSNISGTPSAQALLTTPFIETGFPSSYVNILNYTVTFDYVCMFNEVTACPFGGRNGTNNSNATRGIAVNLGSTDTVFNYGNISGQTANVRTALGYAITLNERHVLVIKDGDFYLDGTKVAQSGATSATQVSSYKWMLFGRNNGGNYTPSETGGSLAPMIGKVYEFSIKDANDDYVLNFEPCIRKSDGVYGMYDTVSNVFHASANEYEFTGGYDE